MRRAAVLVALVALPLAGSAEPQKGDASKQLMQQLSKAKGMLSQMTQEKAALEARLAEIEADLGNKDNRIKALEERNKLLEPLVALQVLPAELQKQKAAYAQLQTQNAGLRQRIQQDVDRMKAFGERYRGTVGHLKSVQQDNQLLVKAVKERTDWIGACTGRNKSLLDANKEMLDHYSHRGVWDAIKDAEPFTGIAAVEKENAVDAYRFKLEDLQVTAWKEPAEGVPAQAAAQPELTEDELPAAPEAEPATAESPEEQAPQAPPQPAGNAAPKSK